MRKNSQRLQINTCSHCLRNKGRNTVEDVHVCVCDNTLLCDLLASAHFECCFCTINVLVLLAFGIQRNYYGLNLPGIKASETFTLAHSVVFFGGSVGYILLVRFLQVESSEEFISQWEWECHG